MNDYTWDKSSNLKTLTDPGGTVTYGYDEIDRVASIAAPNAGGTGTETVGYAYDDTPASGPRAVVETFPGGATQRTELDNAGKPTKIKASTSSGTALSTLTYSYGELVSGVTKQRALIQSVTDQAGTKTAYTYKDTVEDVGRLLKARTTTSAGALVEEWRYSYDKAGNRLRRVRETPTATTTTSYAYNNANQLCWSFTGVSSNACGSPPTGAYSYTFDAAGNQTNGSHTFGYDYAGRTAAIDGYSEGYLTLGEEELVEDGPIAFQNNLLGLGRQTRFSSYVNYHRNPDTGAVVSQISDGTKRYVLRDRLGSTTGLLNGVSGGSIARSYRYDPDGNETTTGTGPETTILFAGGLRVFAGLYHFGARHYDTTTARWTQQDPYLTADTLRFRRQLWADLRQANRYSYVGGDPVNFGDPRGREISCGTVSFATGSAATAVGVASLYVGSTPGGQAVGIGGGLVSGALGFVSFGMGLASELEVC